MGALPSERTSPIPVRLPLLAAIVVLLIILTGIIASTAGATPRCTAECIERVRARAYAATHGGCYSRTCTLRVRAKRDARMIRRLTPYRCGTQRFAIPCYIIRCESHGSWEAANPSGAIGPYQLLGWGAPWPATTRRARLAHHRIAARLWNGGRGASNWVCA